MTVRQHITTHYSSYLMIDGKWVTDIFSNITGSEFDNLMKRVIIYTQSEYNDRGFLVVKLTTVDPSEIEPDNT